MSVTVIIKSATQLVEDFNVECDLAWTIGYLKEKLEELYPSNPKRESQKLIYGGKLLPDHLSLKSVLNHSQERHIIHLVCPIPSKVNTDDSKQDTPEAFPVPPINPGFAPLSHSTFGAMPGATVASLNPGDTVQQYLAAQQMYAQFMTQYLSQYNGAVPPVVPHVPGISVPPLHTPQVPAPQQNLTPNRPQRRAVDRERDYLDYIYMMSRAVLLFALLYYYSSLSRVFLVIIMFICISIYIKVNRQIAHRQQELQRLRDELQRTLLIPSQQAPADIQTAEIQDPVVTETEETVSSSATEGDTSNTTPSQQTEERSFISVMSTTVSLISAFFSSLIPADPVPVNVN